MIKFSLQMYAAIFLSHNIPLILLLNVQVDGNKLVVSYGCVVFFLFYFNEAAGICPFKSQLQY